MEIAGKREFFSKYDLKKARSNALKTPAAHQSEAIKHLIQWYKDCRDGYRGGILVLPTGGGKTFTAIRFLALTALSDGYKILWLAHTHHLLEQAYYGFQDHVGAIAEPKSVLNVRVVSGTIGHFHVADIQPDDDVIIATLQTITKAYSVKHPSLDSFIDSAKGKLFVVFDEAHHAPAPSYRKLLIELRDRCKQMYLLGLTATPVYTDENLQGWLNELFRQGIIYQIAAQKLMALGILARPVVEQQRTNFTPTFDLREYNKWIGTFRDLPEDIITQIAENKERNIFIAEHYAKNRNRYGKTLIFTDRWFQCEAICEHLRKRGIRVGAVYSHIDAQLNSAEERNKRKSDENAQVLDAFRRNQLDVVVNVRMLTEGTDVPDVKTCFITRQTTSSILLTQMVGRALRGPKFGGTDEAYLVFFIDNWQHLINWAEYDLETGGLDAGVEAHPPKPPLEYISIELVRKLAAQMDSGLNINPHPFLTFLPVGWYRVEYTATQKDSEEIERIRRLVMVFEHEREGYERLICELERSAKDKFYDEDVQFEGVSSIIEELRRKFFPGIQEHFGSDINQDIFSIARHIAQNNKAPQFYNFEERSKHDLDIIAEDLISKNLSRIEEDEALRLEYNRPDRYWQVLYTTFELFKSQYNGCVERILWKRRNNTYQEVTVQTASPGNEEPSDEIKRQVKERDGKCLCCGSKNSHHLEVDHIIPRYFGGTNILDNLQTLCKRCNQLKDTESINFRDCQTDLTMPPQTMPKVDAPTGDLAGSPEAWEKFIRRTINLFFRCGAVHEVKIGKKGNSFYNWHIELNAGNNPSWLEPHLKDLLRLIRETKETNGYIPPESITVSAPDHPDVIFKWHDECG